MYLTRKTGTFRGWGAIRASATEGTRDKYKKQNTKILGNYYKHKKQKRGCERWWGAGLPAPQKDEPMFA